MKTSRQLGVLLLFLTASAHVSVAQKAKRPPKNQPATAATAGSAAQDDSAKQSEIYYDVAMGHYYEQEYQITNHSEDADKSIDFYKKAFALDPSSREIGDQLAEMYFQSQHIRDAVNEANSILAKDPDNLGARRLL